MSLVVSVDAILVSTTDAWGAVEVKIEWDVCVANS